MSDDPFLTAEDESPPPAFPAQYAGECSLPGCPWTYFAAGDLIRSDGEDGWECADHAG